MAELSMESELMVAIWGTTDKSRIKLPRGFEFSMVGKTDVDGITSFDSKGAGSVADISGKEMMKTAGGLLAAGVLLWKGGQLLKRKLEERDKKNRMEGYEDGVKEAQAQTVKKVKVVYDFDIASQAALFYFTYCDEPTTDKKRFLLYQKCVLVAKNPDLPFWVKEELKKIYDKKIRNFYQLQKGYLNKLTVNKLYVIKEQILEILRVDGDMTEIERMAFNEYVEYIRSRELEDGESPITGYDLKKR